MNIATINSFQIATRIIYSSKTPEILLVGHTWTKETSSISSDEQKSEGTDTNERSWGCNQHYGHAILRRKHLIKCLSWESKGSVPKCPMPNLPWRDYVISHDAIKASFPGLGGIEVGPLYSHEGTYIYIYIYIYLWLVVEPTHLKNIAVVKLDHVPR